MGNGIVHMLYDKVYSPHAMEGSLTLTVALVSIIAVGGRLIYQYLTIHDDTAKFPLINGAKPWSIFAHKEKMNFIHNAPKLFEQGLKTAGGIFRLQTDDGIQLILSGDHAESLRNHPDLSFTAKTALDFHANIPGFDAFLEGTSEHRILQTTITNYLTHNTHNLNHFLSEEATNALQVHWGDKPEWTDVAVKDTVLHIITQVASRAFLGPELCRNQAWVEHVSSYGSNAGLASQILRVFPKVLRPVAHWFIPACRALRQDLSKCREIVLPVLAKRKREKQERLAAGLKPEKYTDAMEWFEVVAKGRPYDAAAMQIMLAAVGAHSSADAMAQVVFDLADKPELVEEMRQEILEVMPTGEWTKQNIYNLKLMDSVLKESQRLKPATMAPMHRAAVRDTVLPDGTRMVKGSKLMVSGHQSMDPSVYPDVDKFDGHRFLRLRNEGLPTAQFVSTSPCTMGFGHGGQACPGRFFANAELKIALAHMLLKYDFKVKTVARPPVFQVSLLNLANPTENIMVRRREEEICM